MLTTMLPIGVAWWAGADDDARGRVNIAHGAAGSAPGASAASSTDPWARLAQATRLADAAEGPDPCGWSALRADDEVDEAQKRRAEDQLRSAQEVLARRVSGAPDDLGRLLGAHLAGDSALLMEIGVRTQDPVVFGMARLICAALPDIDCERRLSAQRWTALDAGNAAAWWAVAASAPDRAQALDALAQARKVERVTLLKGAAMRRLAMEGAVPASATYQIGIRYEGMLAATTPAALKALQQVCGKGPYGGASFMRLPDGSDGGPSFPRPAAPELKEVCKVSALHYLRVVPDLGDKMVAIALATRWGARSDEMAYSREQVNAMARKLPELLAPSLRETASAQDPRAECRRVRAEMDFLAEASQIGEVQALSRLSEGLPLR